MTTIAYNGYGRLSTLTDGGGHVTSYYYDTQVGNLNGVTYPGYTGPTPVLDANHNYSNIAGPDSVLYKTYDNADNATAIVDGRGDTATYAYADPEYLPTSVSYTVPVGSPATALAGTSYTYDWDGRLSARTDASGGFSFAYDDLDGLTSKTTTYLAPGSGSLPAWSLSYAYYPDGSRKTMTLASGGTNYVSTYTYDKSGRAVKLVNPNGEQTTWAYQANDWLTAQTTNAGSSTPVETTYSYYARGWMQELKTTQGLQGQGLTPTVIADFAGSGGSTPSMTYDALGNRASMTASGFPTGTGTFNGLTSFVYDARDELTSETSARDGNYSSALIYDGVTMNTTTGPGNATSERSVGFTYDAHGDNQIASDTGHYGWGYDGDGNPVTYLSKTNAFDPENRMTAYAIPTGGGHASLTMGYDDDGMRAWKENSSSTRTYFLYDGSDIVAELTSAGALGTYETAGVDGVVSRRAGITTTYFAFDPSGSVSAVLNYTGTVRGNEMFEANGHRDGSYSDRPVDFGGQWGYYGDSETGLTLLGHRYYDSYAGRFLTRDPIGYNGGVNLYSYTANNFENEIDPEGLSRTLGPLPKIGPDGLRFPPGTRFHPDPDIPYHDPHWDITIPQNARSGMPRIKDGSTEWRYYPLRDRSRGHWQEKNKSKRTRRNRQGRKTYQSQSCRVLNNDAIYPDGYATAIAIGGIASVYLLPEGAATALGGYLARTGGQALGDVLTGLDNAFGNGWMSGPISLPQGMPLIN